MHNFVSVSCLLLGGLLLVFGFGLYDTVFAELAQVNARDNDSPWLFAQVLFAGLGGAAIFLVGSGPR